MSRYDHAAELQSSKTPQQQLDFLISDLGRWAKLNPALVSLWAEFSRMSKLMRMEQES